MRPVRADGRVTTVVAILDLVVANDSAQGCRSRPRCEFACKHFKAALGDTLARDLTYSDLNTPVAEYRAKGWPPATIWYDLAILRRAYTLASQGARLPRCRSFRFDAMPELRDVLGRQKFTADAFEAVHGWRPRRVFFHRHEMPGRASAGSPVRTFVNSWRSVCDRAGVSGRILTMQLCCHHTRRVFDRYSIVSEWDLREGVARLAAQADREAAAVE
jgi:hypothetical protein